MNLPLLIAALAPLVACDVSHLGYQYHAPATSYDVPFGSIGSLKHDRQYYHVNKPGILSGVVGTTPASNLQTPIHEFSAFRGGETFNSFLHQPADFGVTVKPILNTVSPTVGPVFGSVNNVVPQSDFGVTVKPILNTVSPTVGQAFGVSTVSSTAAPVIGSVNPQSDFGVTVKPFIDTVSTTVRPIFDNVVPQSDFGVTVKPVGPLLGLAPQLDFGVKSVFNTVSPTVGPAFGSVDNFGVTVKPVLNTEGAVQSSGVEVQKHLYFFSAPDDEPEEVKPRIIFPQAPVKKNLKVLFIKAPTFRTSPVQIPALPQNEEKTRVYVLVKKPEEATIILPTQAPTQPTKPEVYFIKYKTQMEAEEAISQVQGGAGGDVSISANSVDHDHDFLSGIQDSDLAQKLGSGLVSGSTEGSILGFNNQQGFGGFVGVKDSFVSTTPAPIELNQGFGGFGGKIESFSTTLSPLGVVSTTPTILQGGGIHKVYGPPQKRSY
ncbi:uncharacterized protein LOC103312494 [Tribolium castaneum]|uniref:DUF243 domain-containing protein n=1 Tax=Tribolium castaneum TaxID=7070 RepID=D6WHJ7_TRICA|nr:PREDICTED: uncharacterized protein LOC103312494 [Tribolium castaneum]EFA01000.2 hypothetical protein TcasGA2_TC003913 [Tribolium castaneum]|eukprot:XP_015834105.1 PREDICTED: uncharacterized protein LOC103312494 [Tribolium castaneum]